MWQLDPSFDCDDITIQELFALYNASKRLLSADDVTLALGEALRRRGRVRELYALLDEYIHVARRELSPIRPSMQALWAAANSPS